MSNEQIIATLDEYDAAMTSMREARDRLRKAEIALKQAVGARHDTYMDGNELVAALGRRLVENLRA